MILTLELQEGEEMPNQFAQFLLSSGPYYEKRFKQPVPPLTLRLVRGAKVYDMEGGFWIETQAKPDCEHAFERMQSAEGRICTKCGHAVLAK